MAQLWTTFVSASHSWGVIPLQNKLTYAFTQSEDAPLRKVSEIEARCEGAEGAMLVCSSIQPQNHQEQWMLVGPRDSGVSVNGRPLLVGVCALRHADEVRTGDGRRFVLSTERIARVEKFAGSEKPIRCPRCRKAIKELERVVRCPNPQCSSLHHETASRNCWSYSKACAICEGPTDLIGEFKWRPEL